MGPRLPASRTTATASSGRTSLKRTSPSSSARPRAHAGQRAQTRSAADTDELQDSRSLCSGPLPYSFFFLGRAEGSAGGRAAVQDRNQGMGSVHALGLSARSATGLVPIRLNEFLDRCTSDRSDPGEPVHRHLRRGASLARDHRPLPTLICDVFYCPLRS